MNSGSSDHAGQFSLVVGGPFHALLGRIGLIAGDGLPTKLAAISLALLAWTLPALLVIAQSLADTRYAGWGFFTDWTTYTRYLLCIWMMVATERYADGRISMLITQFHTANLIPEHDQSAFRHMLDTTDRYSSSRIAEAIILVLVLVLSVVVTNYTVETTGSDWDGRLRDGEAVLSWAGMAACFVSTPLFLFLTVRWVWRFILWSALLRRVSRLSLQLMPMHPDRSAGLGFMAIYPGIFSGFVFALSCVVASSGLKELEYVQHNPETVWFALAGWIAICLVMFLGPLLVFLRPLYLVRERALLDYGRLAQQHHIAFHRKWIGGSTGGEDIMGSADPSSASDLNASVQAVREMRLFPVDLLAVVQLVLSAGLPMLAVILTQLPFDELVKWVLGSFL